MAVLGRGIALVAIAGGCYSPELRDCTLTCASPDDCADGQVCGTDHFCAAPELAGTCSSLPVDAGVKPRDAAIDAPKMDARPDAGPLQVVLTIAIEGRGRVRVRDVGTCEKAAPHKGHCDFVVPWGAFVTVEADAYDDWRLDRWTTPVCALVPFDSCGFVATQDTSVGVRFRREDD